MSKVSAKDKRQKALFGRVTLKSWYQAQVSRLESSNQIKNFEKYGPLSSFYYSMRVKHGTEYALRTRAEWSALYKDFIEQA